MTKYYKTASVLTEEQPDGSLENVKREFLIEAATFGDAESSSIVFLTDMTNFKETICIEKVEKSKISDLLFNDSFEVDKEIKHGLMEYSLLEGSALYAVEVEYAEENDKGKIKKTKDTVWCPAVSPTDAISLVDEYLRSVEQRDYEIKGVKYSKISHVMVLPETYQKHINRFDSAA